MNVLLAGATGAIGTRLVPQLLEHGYRVTAITRSTTKAAPLRRLGVEVALVDALDRNSVMRAVMRAEPAVVIQSADGPDRREQLPAV